MTGDDVLDFAIRESDENRTLIYERDETRMWTCRIGLALGVDCPATIEGETVAAGWQRWREAIEQKVTSNAGVERTARGK